MYLGTLIWKSLNICFQTDSKESEGTERKAGDAFLSLGQFPHVRGSSMRVVEWPLREPKPVRVVLDSAAVSKEFFWSVRIFSSGEVSSMMHREE